MLSCGNSCHLVTDLYSVPQITLTCSDQSVFALSTNPSAPVGIKRY